MIKVGIEQFQNDFDNYIERVEQGESFIIKDLSGKSVMIVPCDDEVVRVHMEHNDGR
jgi:antitoxin (DNA-binding transcriptional repressor) of toxin-antitoxin stability system